MTATFPVHISVFIDQLFSNPIDQLQRCSNSICQFQSSNPGIATYADVFFVSEFQSPYEMLFLQVQPAAV